LIRLLIASLAIVGLRAAAAEAPNTLTASEQAAGWRLLFDGRTTEGWLEITGKPFPANCWTIEDQSLKALVRRDGFQDIRTTGEFESFELEFDWKILKDGNSGVKYLIQKVDEWTNAAGRQARARGLEYQLADDTNDDAASDPRRLAGSLYSVIAPVPRLHPRIGEFNHSRLVVDGEHVEHWLNGVKVVEFETTAPEVKKLLTAGRRRGPISLQNHSSETWFRNLKIRALR
jgi:hypothetical protein